MTEATITPSGTANRGLGRTVDPRLLHYARGTRRYLVGTVGLGGVTACLVLAQAWLIATAVSDAVTHHRAWPRCAGWWWRSWR